MTRLEVGSFATIGEVNGWLERLQLEGQTVRIVSVTEWPDFPAERWACAVEISTESVQP